MRFVAVIISPRALCGMVWPNAFSILSQSTSSGLRKPDGNQGFGNLSLLGDTVPPTICEAMAERNGYAYRILTMLVVRLGSQ